MRKFHNRKMLAAATIMSCMMASQVIAAPAYNQSGKSNQATTGAITCFDKYLVLDDNADVPNYTATYTIEAGRAVAGTANTPEVFAGIQADRITIKQDNGEINKIHITPEYVVMESSTCENQDCIGEGEVNVNTYKDRILSTYIICLPNQVTIEMVPADE